MLDDNKNLHKEIVAVTKILKVNERAVEKDIYRLLIFRHFPYFVRP